MWLWPLGLVAAETRTPVARYASLLAEGFEPRRVVAITFTDKAAREMCSRVRDALTRLIQEAQSGDERQRWLALSARMDSARIGTIHSFCAEILRTHPAEAGIDPRFDVLDEGLTFALRAQVVDDTLSGFVENPAFTPLFNTLTTRELSNLLHFLIEHRLETFENFAEKLDAVAIVRQYLESALRHPNLADAILELRGMPRAVLEADKLYEMVADLLSLWGSAEDALVRGDVLGCVEALYHPRREKMRLNIGKKDSHTREILGDIQKAYDKFLDPFVGGSTSNSGPNRESEACFAALMPLLAQAFELLSCNYREALVQRQALDFDDLEAGAEGLLLRDDICSRWQGELYALLVDEFQDTNARQRRIVEALAGDTGRLFVVGDARQSIYRFRRADVTVFRAIRQKAKNSGGLVVDR